jgi:hypothetical protein
MRAQARIGVPSQSADKTKACFSLDSRLFISETIYTKSLASIFFLYIFSGMKKLKLGGKREGAGRPSQGKKPYLVTLTEKNVTKAKKRESNFSGLLDRLLAAWL